MHCFPFYFYFFGQKVVMDGQGEMELFIENTKLDGKIYMGTFFFSSSVARIFFVIAQLLMEGSGLLLLLPCLPS